MHVLHAADIGASEHAVTVELAAEATDAGRHRACVVHGQLSVPGVFVLHLHQRLGLALDLAGTQAHIGLHAGHFVQQHGGAVHVAQPNSLAYRLGFFHHAGQQIGRQLGAVGRLHARAAELTFSDGDGHYAFGQVLRKQINPGQHAVFLVTVGHGLRGALYVGQVFDRRHLFCNKSRQAVAAVNRVAFKLKAFECELCCRVCGCRIGAWRGGVGSRWCRGCGLGRFVCRFVSGFAFGRSLWIGRSNRVSRFAVGGFG